MENKTESAELGALLIEALKEIRDLKEHVSEITLLFKPRPNKQRLTKKQKFDLDVKKMRIAETARLIGS